MLREDFVQKLEERRLIPVGRSRVKYVFSTYQVLINIFLIAVLYLCQSTFLLPCYNIIQCIVFNSVIIIVLFIFILKYLYHSFETLLLLSLFLFNGKIR